MARRRMFVSLLACLVGLPAAGLSQTSPVTLRYRFQEGQVLKFDVVQQTEIDSIARGVRTEASVRNHSVRHWKVVSVDPEGIATIELSTERLQMRSVEGGNTIEYDSADPNKQPEQFRDLAKVIGRPLLRLRVSALGEVLEEKSLVAAEGITAMEAGQLLPVLPKKGVVPGAAWTHKFDIKLLKPRKEYPARHSFTLSDVKDGKATIKFDTVVLAPVDNPAVKAQLVQHRPRGIVAFDVQRGLVIGQTLGLDETIVGFLGPASSFKIKSTSTERLIDISLAKAAGSSARRK